MENIEEKRQETPNDVAGFVAKTYEILNVYFSLNIELRIS
jgi:hypothetical protein